MKAIHKHTHTQIYSNTEYRSCVNTIRKGKELHTLDLSGEDKMDCKLLMDQHDIRQMRLITYIQYSGRECCKTGKTETLFTWTRHIYIPCTLKERVGQTILIQD